MAERQEFLGRLQQQLGAWTDWVKQLDDVAVSSTSKLRTDARAAYEQRAGQVRELIQQGKVQWERATQAGEDAWPGVVGGLERAWSALRDAAASLAAQPLPVATAPAPPATRPAKVAAKRAKAAPKKAKKAKKAAGTSRVRSKAPAKKKAIKRAKKVARKK